jgi:hypothetical protein
MIGEISHVALHLRLLGIGCRHTDVTHAGTSKRQSKTSTIGVRQTDGEDRHAESFGAACDIKLPIQNQVWFSKSASDS